MGVRYTCGGTQVHSLIDGGDIARPGRSAGQLLQHHVCQVIYEGWIGVEGRHPSPVLQQTTGPFSLLYNVLIVENFTT